jgi:hypothetical protein
MQKGKRNLALAAAAGVGGLVGNFDGSGVASASTIASLYATTSATVVTVSGTVTAILGNNPSATSDTFVIADGTGSVELFEIATSTYTANYGDNITVTGADSVFDGAPEYDNTGTTISVNTVGSGVQGPPMVVTIPTFNASGTGNGSSGGTTNSFGDSAIPPVAEAYVELEDVTLTTTGDAPVTSLSGSTSYTIHDTLANTATMFTEGSTTYANQVLAAYSGVSSATLSGPMNITGFVDMFKGEAELYPLSFSPVPEPASAALLGMGALAVLVRRPRKPDQSTPPPT